MTHELESAFDAFLSRRGRGDSGTSSIVSASSSSAGNSNGHERRRTARRLERILSQMEAYCIHEHTGYTALDQEILQETSPLFVEILTVEEDKRAMSADQHDWINEEVSQLYAQASISAVHLLSLVELDDHLVDGLLNRVGEELFLQQQSPYSTLLVSLMKLLHRQLDERPSLPLLSSHDCLWLVTTMTDKCITDLKTSVTDEQGGALAMRCFLIHVLRHMASLKEEHETMHDWCKAHLVAVDPADVVRETTSFFQHLATLGEETLESVLDLIVDKADIDTILNHASSALTMAGILEKSFALSFVKTMRSLFVGLVNAIVHHHNHHQSHQSLALILALASKVLPTAAHDDKAVQQAAGLVLYLALGHEGITEDVAFLLDFCSEYIPSALLASLVLPTGGNNAKETTVRLVQSCPMTSPWNHIIGRKIPITDNPIESSDRILQTYAHQFVPAMHKP
jgi:hypothetical protein